MSMSQTRKLILLALIPFVLGLFSGCTNKAKEEAAISIEEAKLNISSAKKSGMSMMDFNLSQAESKISRAEKSYKRGDYKAATKDAVEASKLARYAKTDAENKRSLRTKPTEKPRQTTKKKTGKSI